MNLMNQTQSSCSKRFTKWAYKVHEKCRSDKQNLIVTFDQVCINSGQILSESKVGNNTIEINDLTVMKLPKLNDNQSIPKCVC